MGDKDIALLARQDKLDIAIDLNGYTFSRPGIFIYRVSLHSDTFLVLQIQAVLTSQTITFQIT